MAGSVPQRGGSAARIVRQVVELASAQGHAAPQLCRSAGISWHTLQDPDATVPAAAVERLSLQVAKLIKDPNIGLRLARSAGEVTHFDPGLLMMMACASLEESIVRMERMQAYWADAARILLVRLPDGLCLRHDQPGPVSEFSRLSDEAALAKVAHGLRALVGADARARVVRFRHARPADVREHRAVFQCDVSFDAPHTELELSAALLARPLPNANEAYRNIFQSQVEHALARLPASSGLAHDVRRAAQAALLSGHCSLAATAHVCASAAFEFT